MNGSELRPILAMATQRLYIRTKVGIFQDDFETSWEELDQHMKDWYNRIATLLPRLERSL